MKKHIIAALCAILMLGGGLLSSCNRVSTEAEPPNASGHEAEYTLPESAAAPETHAASETPTVGPETNDAALPEVIFSISSQRMLDLPSDVALDEALADAISLAVHEQTGGLDILVRVLYVGIPEYYSGSDLHVEYEAYPKDCEKLSMITRLGDVMQLEIARDNGVYTTGVPRNDVEEQLSKLKAAYAEERSTAITDLYLDREGRVCILSDEKHIVTEQYFKDNVYYLNDCNIAQAVGDTAVLVAREGYYYSEPFAVWVSRDGGASWKKTVPELKPLGKDGRHSELNFTDGRIQIKEDGRVFIFTCTNLASLNVLTVPAYSDEAVLLFREQIGGYETTPLVDAAMISDKRGYITLMHPKYAASNAIYRTTDGGLTWLRCQVPMPAECTDVWEMRLYLPEVRREWTEWTMVGTWDGGSCVYESFDGGWTWEIREVSR